MKRILITGSGSYIGTSVEHWLCQERYRGLYKVDTINMIDNAWRDNSFSGYDVIFHVAGIAHADIENITEEKKQLYYKVNCDLAVETAEKAKVEGVKQFIFMSSIIVYGEGSSVWNKRTITKDTIPSPTNFYGDSKWRAEKKLQALSGDDFQIAILRPPMIYGEGCKGNYQTLKKIAMKIPVFPDYPNERSMLKIESLCETVRLLIETGAGGVFFPQNLEYVKTSDMVKALAIENGKKMVLLKGFNWLICLLSVIPGRIGKMVNKAFGSLVYDKSLTESKRETNLGVTNRPKVSIVTVAYNSEETIRKTIESVLNQSYSNIEYRIVDGKSTDNTVQIAKQYETQFAKRGIEFIVTSEKDNGIYDAMNKGIRDASGEIIGIINSDDWYEQNAIQTVVDAYNKTRFDYYYADVRLIKENGKTIIKHSKKDRLVTSRHWNHPTCFVTKNTYDSLGVFNCKGIHDDFDFFLRVRKANKKIVIENKVIANFKTGGVSNKKSLKKSIERCKDRYRCYKDNSYSALYSIECVIIEIAKMVLS